MQEVVIRIFENTRGINAYSEQQDTTMSGLDSQKIDIISERYGGTSLCRNYVPGNKRDAPLAKTSLFGESCVRSTRSLKSSIASLFVTVFLPQGYPESVSQDYLEYQIYDTFQAFCSSITGTLATRAVLQGAGVGDDKATVLSATITWILKDGIGMVGRIVFAWSKGTYLDSDCKKWRLVADILNDLGTMVNLLAGAFKPFFRLLSCVSALLFAIVGVAGGATRAALTQHQARRNNMADVSAKDGSQETLVNLAGMVCSLLIVPLVEGNQILIWSLFLLFTLLHLWTNYRAVKAVRMDSLNQARFHFVVQNFLETSGAGVLSIPRANMLEPILGNIRRPLRVNLGCSLSTMSDSYARLTLLCQIYRTQNYLLDLNSDEEEVYVVLGEGACARDQISAMFQAELLCYVTRGDVTTHQDARLQEMIDVLTDDSVKATSFTTPGEKFQEDDKIRLLALTHKYTIATLPHFLKALEAQGWNISYVLFGADEWRARWNDKPGG